MLDLLPSTHELSNESKKKYSLIWKGKLACLLLFNERKVSLAPIVNHFTETVSSTLEGSTSHIKSYKRSFTYANFCLIDQSDKLP